MGTEQQNGVRLEIGHVLFIDIVGYSKLLITQQSDLLLKLKEIVRGTEQFRIAEAEGKLLRLPTGDGGALVFRNNPEAPVLCAMDISRELKKHPELRVRMGIHSGPVHDISDLNEQANIAGAGINIAQRVMDCGDAGHILLSRRVVEDLEQHPRWRPYLHELGECEVKHGLRVGIASLYDDEIGNRELPTKIRRIRRRAQVRWAAAAIALVLIAAVAVTFLLRRPSQTKLNTADKSIAVLPFENLSSDRDNAYFADGMQDEILTHLAKIANLKVISRTSVMQYKTGVARNLRMIGEELGVAHVVEGSVQRAGNKVRVNAQLIDARNDSHVWASTYDRDLADVFIIQSEIAKAIADQLQAKLSPNEKKAIEQPPTSDLPAFDLYSRGKTILLTRTQSVTSEQDLRQAAELLEEAVKRDPSFFDAYCELAYAHEALYAGFGGEHTPARLARAEAALQAARGLRPEAGETHRARAQYLYYGLRDYAGALAELEAARRALPNDPRILELTGYILRRRGQQEEGLRHLERAVELDPRDFDTLQQIAVSYQYLNRFADAITILDRALTIVSDDIETKATRAQFEFCWRADTRSLHQTIDPIIAERPGAIFRVADAWFLCALAERDVAAAERSLIALGDNPWWGDATIQLSRSFGEGLLARITKNDIRARAAFGAARAQQETIVQAQPDYAPALCVLGLIDAALGHTEAALNEGRRAIALLPVEKDAINGSRMIQYFAITTAWAGEKDLALQQLESGLRAPAASVALSYGVLKLLPFWDPLRGDPRFEKIVSDLAPKHAN